MSDMAAPAVDRLYAIARIGRERFAFRVADVEEVLDTPVVTRVPSAHAGLLGQLRYRDRTLSVYDGGWLFGVTRDTTGGPALLVRADGHRIAVLVDDIDHLTALDPAARRAVPPGADPEGVLAHLLLLSRPAREAEVIGLVRAAGVVARIRAMDGTREDLSVTEEVV